MEKYTWLDDNRYICVNKYTYTYIYVCIKVNKHMNKWTIILVK